MAWHAASLDIFTRLRRVTDVYLASAEADQAARHAAARGAAKALVDAFGVYGSPLDAPPSPGAVEVRVLDAVRQTVQALHPAGSPEERRAAALAAYRSLLSLYASDPSAPPLDASWPKLHDRHRAPPHTRGLLLTDGDEELAASLELLDELARCLVRLHGAENAPALADCHRDVAARLRTLADSDDSGELRPCYATALAGLIPAEARAASPQPSASALEASRAPLRRAVALMCRHVARDVLGVGCRQGPLCAPAAAKGAGQAAAAAVKPAIAGPAMCVKMEEESGDEGPDDETGDLDDQDEGLPPIVAMFVKVAEAFEALGGESELARAWASAAWQAAALEPDDKQERLTVALARTADFGLKEARGRKRRAAAEEAERNVRHVIAANWEKLLKSGLARVGAPDGL